MRGLIKAAALMQCRTHNKHNSSVLWNMWQIPTWHRNFFLKRRPYQLHTVHTLMQLMQQQLCSETWTPQARPWALCHLQPLQAGRSYGRTLELGLPGTIQNPVKQIRATNSNPAIHQRLTWSKINIHTHICKNENFRTSKDFEFRLLVVGVGIVQPRLPRRPLKSTQNNKISPPWQEGVSKKFTLCHHGRV
jgi:hypothetical protein